MPATLNIKGNLSKIRKRADHLPSLFTNILNRRPLYFVVEDAEWVIKRIGETIVSCLRKQGLLKPSVTLSPYFLRNKIVHYGSKNTFLNCGDFRRSHKSNRNVLTWYHVANSDSDVDRIPELCRHVKFIHTSCELTRMKLAEHGADEKRIVIIPIGVDTSTFKPLSFDRKKEIRREFGIPEDRICIGSFQKDGNGWGEGLEPKVIKGPDIFCDVVERLNDKFPVHVLLTGPARGYVKNRLKGAGIPFTHRFVEKYMDMRFCYSALDLYIVASRIEGGPEAILECMATGVPVVTTRVGQAPDIIVDGENGYLVDVGDVDALFARSEHVIINEYIKSNLVINGLKTVDKYDWNSIALQYYKSMYAHLL